MGSVIDIVNERKNRRDVPPVRDGLIPYVITRRDDGRLLVLNDGGEDYSFADSGMDCPYRYSYGRLLEDERSRGKFYVSAWGRELSVSGALDSLEKIREEARELGV